MITSNTTTPAFVEKDEAYKRALEFMEAATAKEGVEDYKWVLDYAKGLWEYRNKVFALLDEKAEGIIKYLGGGTGLFAIAALAKVDSSNNYIAFWTLPAIVVALVAILLALLSKAPGPFPSPPTIENAKQYADGLKTEQAAIAAFLGQLNLACEKARLICECKAKVVGCAVIATYTALALLLVPLLVAISQPPPH
jgi:hypothetical protein